MRLLLYLTPVLWNLESVGHLPVIVKYIMKANPIYYIIQGYRDCFFFNQGILAYNNSMLVFWIETIVLFVFGSYIMCKFKKKFIDLI